MRFGIGIAAGPQNGNEDMGLTNFTGFWIHHGHRMAGIIYEDPLPGLVVLPHGRIQFLSPQPVKLTKSGIDISIYVSFPILQPQPLPGYVLAS